MGFSEEHTEVPIGAILAALTMIEVSTEDEDRTSGRSEEIADLLKVWKITVLTQAFGLVIYGAMSMIHPAEGSPDCLHMVVPALLTKLRKIDEVRPFGPTMAGVLTAAALGEDAYQWRASLGPVTNAETSAWYYTAWLLADFIDSIVLQEPGKFVRESVRLVTDAASKEDPG